MNWPFSVAGAPNAGRQCESVSSNDGAAALPHQTVVATATFPRVQGYKAPFDDRAATGPSRAAHTIATSHQIKRYQAHFHDTTAADLQGATPSFVPPPPVE